MLSFIRRLFHDARDDLIAELRSERDYLRSLVDEKERQVLALSNTHAYRLVHKDKDVVDGPPTIKGPFAFKDEVAVPKYTLKDKEELVDIETRKQ